MLVDWLEHMQLTDMQQRQSSHMQLTDGQQRQSCCVLQTDSYLEQLTDSVAEAEMSTQTDPFKDRPSTPLFVPAKAGLDVTTQIEAGDLFDFDFEVHQASWLCHCVQDRMPVENGRVNIRCLSVSIMNVFHSTVDDPEAWLLLSAARGMAFMHAPADSQASFHAAGSMVCVCKAELCSHRNWCDHALLASIP